MKDMNNENQDKLSQDSLSQDDLNQNDSSQSENQKDIATVAEQNDPSQFDTDEEQEDRISFADRIKASFTSRKFKGGAYATAVSAIVIIMILVVNILVTELDLKIDVSKEGMYTLTDTTKDYVKDIRDNITIYYMVPTGSEDKTFTEIIEKYASLSNKIKVEYKDPVLYPNFASQYTDEKVNSNSLIVVNESNKRAKYVDNNDMYKTEIDYNTYQTNVTGIDVEGQVTSALQYVTTEDLPVMYTVSGHGEPDMGATLASSLTKANVTTKSLATLTVKSIPEDCSLLFINGPQKDYTEDEITMIKDYLAKGGDAIILVDYAAEGLDNFNSLMNYYGISFVNGIVLEGEQGYYMGQYVNNLVPSIKSHDITSSILSKQASVVMPGAIGIQALDSKRSTTQIDPLFTTSDSAYSKIDVSSNTVEKQDGDIDGPFNLGVAITEKYNEIESKIIVLGSALMVDEQMMSYPSIGNLDLMINSINFVSNKESSIAIRTRSVTQQYLTMNAAQVNFWAILIVVIIPVLVLAFGGYICIRRRKK